MPNAIQISGVSKTFGPKVAVHNLDLVIPEGSLYGFIGPNGAGKTTTIRMIMSIIFPDRGELSVLGKRSAVESKDRIGYLPEERGVYRKMKVGEFLEYMGRLKGLDGPAVRRLVPEWLERVGLKDVRSKKCEELSKGMQQKIQFIAAVIHQPDLIILDEPFSGLDPVNRRLLRALIDEQHQAGRTLIFSTHAMFEAEQLCTHLFMINRGHKVLDAPLSQVWAKFDPRTIQLEPLEPVADPVAASWARVPGVRSVHLNPRGAEVQLADNADIASTMAALSASAPMRRIELKRPNLEDIFIQLVGGDAAAMRAELESEGHLDADAEAATAGSAR